MAGIGFELRKILRRDTLTTDMTALLLAGMISSGPWIISIIGILLLGIVIAVIPQQLAITPVMQFQISVTYLIATSLIISGFAQHSFTRYVADQLFLHHTAKIIPNLNGMIAVVTLFSGVFAFLLILAFFPAQTIAYRLLLMGSFVVLCNIWMSTNLLAGLKDYKVILIAFFFSYTLIVILGYYWRSYGLEGFMLSFLLGQLILFAIFHLALYRHYPTHYFIDFDFLKRKNMHVSLVISSFFYNLGIWIDKFIFWFIPATSYVVLGPLRGSIIYDVPIFLAYLALIPGMAVFLLRIETDFADFYFQFYEAIRNGESLEQIQTMRNRMVAAGQEAIMQILKVQTMTIIFVFLFGEKILRLLHISVIYKNLFFIDVIGASLQVVFLAILNILFYLDLKRKSLFLCVLFVTFNFIFTLLTIYAGPLYYGYGFTLALVLVSAYGVHLLKHELTDLDYKAIMLRSDSY